LVISKLTLSYDDAGEEMLEPNLMEKFQEKKALRLTGRKILTL
jgi:hypothetical protein